MTMAEQVWTVAHRDLEHQYRTKQESSPKPIQAPEAAHVRSSSRQSGYAISHGQTRDGGGATLPYGSDAPKSTSVSSGEDGSTIMPIPSVDPEKSYAKVRDQSSMPQSRQIDLEKATENPRLHVHGVQPNVESISLTHSADEACDALRVQEENALRILLFLSGPCVLLSALNAMWTCVAIVITLLTQPARLCAKRPSFFTRFAGLLGPALNLQFRGIFTPSPPHADQEGAYRPAQLVAVLLLSPFLSIGLMLVSWVVAVYWASSLVVGDPAGLDKQDDGRDTVLGLRKGWERWLMRGIRNV